MISLINSLFDGVIQFVIKSNYDYTMFERIQEHNVLYTNNRTCTCGYFVMVPVIVSSTNIFLFPKQWSRKNQPDPS